jgi:MFS family permease
MPESTALPEPGADPGAPLPGHIRWRALATLAVLSAIIGLNTVDRNMFALLLPKIRVDIPLGDAALGFLMGPAFIVVYSACGVPLAMLADRAGRRPVIAWGLAAWSAVTLLTGMAGTFVHLLVARIALGIGEASNMAPTSALIADTFTERGRVLALAVFAAGGPAAVLLFYPVIGAVTEAYGWRAAFPLMGLVGFVFVGALLLVVREAPLRGASMHHTQGEAWRQVVRRPGFVVLVAAGTLFSVNYSAMVAWLPSFLVEERGLSSAQAAHVLGLYKGGLGCLATLAGGLVVAGLMRFDRRWLAWAPGLFCAGMVPAQALLLYAGDGGAWQVGLGMETVLLAATTPCTFALLAALVPDALRSTGSAVYLLVFNLVGQSVGPLVVGALAGAGGPHRLAGALAIVPLSAGLAAGLFMVLAGVMARVGEGKGVV